MVGIGCGPYIDWDRVFPEAIGNARRFYEQTVAEGCWAALASGLSAFEQEDETDEMIHNKIEAAWIRVIDKYPAVE